jgi:hypothetical protein
MLTALVAEECPGATVKRPALPPDLGAAVMACFHTGGDPAALFEKLRIEWNASHA